MPVVTAARCSCAHYRVGMVRPAGVSNAAVLKFTEADILMGDNCVAAEAAKLYHQTHYGYYLT